MFVKNSYASYDNNVVENVEYFSANVVGPPVQQAPPVNNVVGPPVQQAPPVNNVVGPPVQQAPLNYVYGPVILVPENMEPELKNSVSAQKELKNLLKGLTPSYPDRKTENKQKYLTFAINNIKKYAIFTLYYSKIMENETHNEKDIFYKFENSCRILEGNQNNPTDNQNNFVAKINIDVETNIITFIFNADMIKDRTNIRFLYIHAQWWN